MKRYSSTASVALAVLTVLGLAGPVAAGEQVPFKGSFAGDAFQSGVPPIVDVAVDATGKATDLGRFTLTIPHHVDLSTRPRTSFGSYQFVAANGDTLSADFTGQVFIVHVSPTGIPDVLAAVEIATITGGTGRFADAQGTFTVERVVLVDTATGDRTTAGSFNGTISSPGAVR